MKRFWIPHPAVSEPVGPVRWIKWHLAEWLGSLARRLELDVIEPGWRDDPDRLPF